MDATYDGRSSRSTSPGPLAVPRRRHAGGVWRRGGGTLIDVLLTWQGRVMMRADFLALDEHLLADAGLTRHQAQSEAAKPFWRA